MTSITIIGVSRSCSSNIRLRCRQELRKFMREVKRGKPTAAISLQVIFLSSSDFLLDSVFVRLNKDINNCLSLHTSYIYASNIHPIYILYIHPIPCTCLFSTTSCPYILYIYILTIYTQFHVRVVSVRQAVCGQQVLRME